MAQSKHYTGSDRAPDADEPRVHWLWACTCGQGGVVIDGLPPWAAASAADVARERAAQHLESFKFTSAHRVLTGPARFEARPEIKCEWAEL